jgi:hypothetical protein
VSRPALSCRGAAVEFGRYTNGCVAILLVMPSGETLAKVSVNMESTGARQPAGDEEVWLKGWSENRGLPRDLEAAGVLTLTGDTYPLGAVTAQLARLTPAAVASLRAQEEGH